MLTVCKVCGPQCGVWRSAALQGNVTLQVRRFISQKVEAQTANAPPAALSLRYVAMPIARPRPMHGMMQILYNFWLHPTPRICPGFLHLFPEKFDLISTGNVRLHCLSCLDSCSAESCWAQSVVRNECCGTYWQFLQS